MKKVFVMLAALSVATMANAQQQQRTPPVGGSSTGEVVAPSAKDARRGIMRETLNRQYTGEEIEEYRRAIDAYDRSKSGVYSEAAKVVRRRIQVGLSADASVHELRLDAENVGALVFTDALGAPWAIDDVIAPAFLTATRAGNMVIFRPNLQQQGAGGPPVRYARGSVTVLLEGLNSTIPFALSFGNSREVDGQVEAQVQARNPRAPVNAVQSGAMGTDESFGLFLDGEPPNEASKVRTSVRGVDAWMYQGRLYVRTSLALHSPAFQLFGSSASGLSVYRFDRAPSVINAISDGAIIGVGIGEN